MSEINSRSALEADLIRRGISHSPAEAEKHVRGFVRWFNKGKGDGRASMLMREYMSMAAVLDCPAFHREWIESLQR